MATTRFDTISKLFAQRRLSRRQALKQGGTGLAAAGLAAARLKSAAAQDGTPAAEATPATAFSGEKIPYLFVQSFQSGSITPIEGTDDRYSVTLEQGLGQTIYFADRPSRDVGATPTRQFLANLGFPPDNPPNAALLLETGPGETDIAVVELFNPSYDEATHTATYEVQVLQNWQDDLDLGLTAASADLAMLAPNFGTAHVLIDDCADDAIVCRPRGGLFGGTVVGWFPTQGYCWNYSMCVPCHPYGHANPYNGAAWDWWTRECNNTFPDCKNDCDANSR